MRTQTAACLTALAMLLCAGCAGSSQKDDTAGAAPIDTVHIKSGDTLPPAGAGAIRRDTASQQADSGAPTIPGKAQQDSTSGLNGAGAIDTTRGDSAK
jgi:hypothetical protein